MFQHNIANPDRPVGISLGPNHPVLIRIWVQTKVNSYKASTRWWDQHSLDIVLSSVVKVRWIFNASRKLNSTL
jgi:hypothetical protein